MGGKQPALGILREDMLVKLKTFLPGEELDPIIEHIANDAVKVL